MKKSISFRLTCWFSAAFILSFIAFGVTLWADLRYSLRQARDPTLTRRVTRVVDFLSGTQNESPSRREADFTAFAKSGSEGNLMHVYDARGLRVYPKRPDPPDFPWPTITLARSDTASNVKYAGSPYRVMIRNVTVHGEPFTIAIAGKLDDQAQLLTRFSVILGIAAPVLLLVSAFSGYLLSRHALDPVDRITAAVRSISIGNLSERLPVYSTSDELQRLTETCNGMLARLEGAVGRINRFTADASHELRNPISFIRVLSEDALRNPDLPEECRQGFEEILAESVEAGRLLEDMLILARADAGRVEVNMEPIDVAEVVEDICDKARPMARKKGQSLVVRSTTSPAQISGDRASIRRLLWTLLDNAIKYTPERGRIEITLDRQKDQTTIRVRDNGVGIPQDVLPRVFERFFRVDPARQAEGTGLGLAIAKWIADAHNALLLAESTPGEGTVFSVVFQTEPSV